jgi:hypothetical protein
MTPLIVTTTATVVSADFYVTVEKAKGAQGEDRYYFK